MVEVVSGRHEDERTSLDEIDQQKLNEVFILKFVYEEFTTPKLYVKVFELYIFYIGQLPVQRTSCLMV